MLTTAGGYINAINLSPDVCTIHSIDSLSLLLSSVRIALAFNCSSSAFCSCFDLSGRSAVVAVVDETEGDELAVVVVAINDKAKAEISACHLSTFPRNLTDILGIFLCMTPY